MYLFRDIDKVAHRGYYIFTHPVCVCESTITKNNSGHAAVETIEMSGAYYNYTPPIYRIQLPLTNLHCYFRPRSLHFLASVLKYRYMFV